MQIFVARLNFKTTEDALKTLFSQYGEVTSVKIITDKETGKSKGYGFVEMPSVDAAHAAVVLLNEKEFEGSIISCKKSEPKPQKPFKRY